MGERDDDVFQPPSKRSNTAKDLIKGLDIT